MTRRYENRRLGQGGENEPEKIAHEIHELHETAEHEHTERICEVDRFCVLLSFLWPNNPFRGFRLPPVCSEPDSFVWIRDHSWATALANLAPDLKRPEQARPLPAIREPTGTECRFHLL